MLPPFHTSKWALLVGKPHGCWVPGYQHFRKPPYHEEGTQNGIFFRRENCRGRWQDSRKLQQDPRFPVHHSFCVAKLCSVEGLGCIFVVRIIHWESSVWVCALLGCVLFCFKKMDDATTSNLQTSHSLHLRSFQTLGEVFGPQKHT